MKTNERRSGCSGIVLVIVIVLATWNLISPFIPEQRSSYENVDLTYGVYYASSRNWHEKQSLEWLFEGDGKIVISDTPPHKTFKNKEITILVHGYASREDRISFYFNELIRYLKTSGYSGDFLIYVWPSLAKPSPTMTREERRDWWLENCPPSTRLNCGYRILDKEILDYRRDLKLAGNVGVEGLLELLQMFELRTDIDDIILLAHSMGSYVVTETLEDERANFKKIKRLILLAPDLSRDAVSNEQINKSLAHLDWISVYYSKNDDALRLSQIVNFENSLGLYGPKKPLPVNLHGHDVSKISGFDSSGYKVHGHYLTSEGAATIKLIDAFK